jgi:hypothetical protein
VGKARPAATKGASVGLEFCSDVSAASWLNESGTGDWWQLVTLGPAGFDAYARLRFIPDPQWSGQSEADVVPEDLESDVDQISEAMRALVRFTSTPDDLYFCFWVGYPGVVPVGTSPPMVRLPNREYLLFRGSVQDLSESIANSDDPYPPYSPAFVWPADHKWCITSDVDPHWAIVGGPKPAIEALVGVSSLDVVPLVKGETPPTYF